MFGVISVLLTIPSTRNYLSVQPGTIQGQPETRQGQPGTKQGHPWTKQGQPGTKQGQWHNLTNAKIVGGNPKMLFIPFDPPG